MTGLIALAPCALSSRRVSIDFRSGILDGLRPSRLLRCDRRGKLLGTVRREWLHAEFEQLLLELLRLLNFLQFHGKTRDDFPRGTRRRDDPLPRLPIEAGHRGSDRWHIRQQRRRLGRGRSQRDYLTCTNVRYVDSCVGEHYLYRSAQEIGQRRGCSFVWDVLDLEPVFGLERFHEELMRAAVAN